MSFPARKVVKVTHVGGRVVELLECGHKVTWNDGGSWKINPGDKRGCYRCSVEDAKGES